MLEPAVRTDRADCPGRLFLVFEIGEDLALGRSPTQGFLNRVELRVGVSTLTKPITSEGSGYNIGRLKVLTLGDAKRDTMLPQYRIHFVAKPGAVSKFEGHPQPTRFRIRKEGVEARYVSLEIRRKLEEHHAHPSSSHDRSECTRQG